VSKQLNPFQEDFTRYKVKVFTDFKETVWQFSFEKSKYDCRHRKGNKNLNPNLIKSTPRQQSIKHLLRKSLT